MGCEYCKFRVWLAQVLVAAASLPWSAQRPCTGESATALSGKITYIEWQAPTWQSPRKPDVVRRIDLASGEIVSILEASLERPIIRSFCYSPDGTRFLYESGDGRRGPGYLDHELYMGNKMGDQPARLTDNSDYDGDPAWSPDGKSVAFVRGRYGMGTQLHLLDLGSLKDRPIAAPGIRDVAYPMWSPDGRRLLAVGRGDGKAAGVAECDLAAETVRWLPGVPPKISSISPDGKWLAFTVQHKINILVRLLAIGNEDHTHRVHVLDLGTGKLKLVGPKTGLYDWDTRPAWSPDGQRLAWIRNYRKTRCRVLVHDARRKCVRKIVLPREEGRGWGPRVWSPDGLRLACVTRNQSAHRFGLHIVNLGTGQVSRVLTSELEIWLCAWEQP